MCFQNMKEEEDVTGMWMLRFVHYYQRVVLLNKDVYYLAPVQNLSRSFDCIHSPDYINEVLLTMKYDLVMFPGFVSMSLRC